ncbi:hypothetical protein K466DRAFT_599069 [Polyporus arcularius HHB13444]|uniref:Uncharacterized protein n=1 Tax=Polyporus arcularius HHB13444 TaxID=1314778 RepID=A0A5C3PG09_9APHY|nr:hypothetical protein K466DRAFT_599069 [Polyporus arcularius HHB13444]
MRSPILAISLVAAAIATASARPTPSRDAPLSPTVQGGVGTFHVKTPRQYLPNEPSREIDRQRSEAEREHAGGFGDRPPTPRPSNILPLAPHGESGGVSTSSPATGLDAGQGGGNASSADGDLASGADALKQYLGNVVAPATPSQFSAGDNSYGFQPQDSAYTRHHDPNCNTGSNDDNSDDNSNIDGADGQSIKGGESRGGHSGNTGSTEGGHVYNCPSNNDGDSNE